MTLRKSPIAEDFFAISEAAGIKTEFYKEVKVSATWGAVFWRTGFVSQSGFDIGSSTNFSYEVN